VTVKQNAPTGGPLAGVKVVELCHLIAGPYVGMLLADEGADVVKVEPPSGELTRHREPIRTTDQGSMSGYFASLNRRKRSIAIDLKTESGIDLLHRLLKDADVFTTNMRAAALGRLGIHPDTLRERYPALIVVSMSGFGLVNSGPDANRAGLAMVAEAIAGTTGLTRDREGRPTWCGFAMGDILTGMTAHAAVLLGLRERDQTRNGRLIDLSLTESTLPLATVALARVQATDENLAKVAGANDFHGVPYGTFAASDGFYNIGVNRDDFWVRLCQAMHRPELATDPRFATYVERARRQHEVEQILEGWSVALTREEVIDALMAVDVPVAPVYTMAEVLESEHFRQRGTFVTVDDAVGGTYQQPKDPTGFGLDSPARVPHLGQDQDSVLHELGLRDDEIDDLRAKGAFGVPQDADLPA
jgi:crotonobetainyl-CoA:carnitine CoA-transferase CaiB-like acyl-CoA transferase